MYNLSQFVKTLKEWLDDYDEKKEGEWPGAGKYRASQAIRTTMRMFSGAYIGRSIDFLERVAGHLPKKFPRAGGRSVRRCRAFVWEAPRDDDLHQVSARGPQGGRSDRVPGSGAQVARVRRAVHMHQLSRYRDNWCIARRRDFPPVPL